MLATVHTTRFGEIEVSDEEIFRFSEGLPGFEDMHQFVIFRTNPEAVFWYLHSLQNPELCFIIADPFMFYPEYEFDLNENVSADLKLDRAEQLKIWSIITVPAGSSIEHATINLVAPIVINTVTKQSKQVILYNSNYSIKQKLLSGDE